MGLFTSLADAHTRRQLRQAAASRRSWRQLARVLADRLRTTSADLREARQQLEQGQIAMAGLLWWLALELDTVTNERTRAEEARDAALARVRELDKEAARYRGSLDLAQIRAQAAHSAALRWAADRIDPGPGSDQPHERGIATRLRLWADNNQAGAISIADQIGANT